MKQGIIFYILVLSSFCPAGASAQKLPLSKHKPCIKLLESYTQRIMPGRREAKPVISTHFIIIWEAGKYPETFFWRGNNGFLPCSVVKVHKITGKPPNFIQGIDYAPENIPASMIHKGDTLELTPIDNGKFPVPPEIAKNAVNTLFFKTGKSGWLSLPVKNITKKHDIDMP